MTRVAKQAGTSADRRLIAVFAFALALAVGIVGIVLVLLVPLDTGIALPIKQPPRISGSVHFVGVGRPNAGRATVIEFVEPAPLG